MLEHLQDLDLAVDLLEVHVVESRLVDDLDGHLAAVERNKGGG